MSVTSLIEKLDPRAEVVAVVVVGAAADEVTVDHTGFVDKDAATDFQIELALGHGGHAASLHSTGTCWNFHAMADAGDGFVLVEEVLGDADQVGVFADVFGCAATGEEDAEIVLFLNFTEGDFGFDLITLPFLGDGPTGTHFVHHHLVAPLFRRGDYRTIASFLQAVEGVEGVEGFGGVADDDEDGTL